LGAGFCTLELTVRPATLDGVDGPDFYVEGHIAWVHRLKTLRL